MVALLVSDPLYSGPTSGPDLFEAPTPVRSRERHLRALAPGEVQMLPGTDRLVGGPSGTEIVAAVAVAVIVAVLALSVARPLQGSPPGTSWSAIQQAARVEVPPIEPGDSIITVQPGDTLWAIAGEVAADLDRRQAVQMLAERNGGSSIQAGQALVVPASFGNP
jgi:hypothetical protein